MRARGDEVALRSTSVSDLPDLMALWNDGRVMKWVGFPDGLGYDATSVAQWFVRLRARPHCRASEPWNDAHDLHRPSWNGPG